MIWFDIKTLEEKLIRNEVSEKTGYHYLLAFLILTALAVSSDDTPSFVSKYWKLADFIIGILILVLGTRKVFSINREGDNRDFLKRYFSISFVHTIRIAVLFFIILLFFNLLDEFLLEKLDLAFLNQFENEDFIKFTLGLLFNILFYFFLIRSFKKVNESTGEEFSMNKQNQIRTDKE